MSIGGATHCIPWDEDCTICNPPAVSPRETTATTYTREELDFATAMFRDFAGACMALAPSMPREVDRLLATARAGLADSERLDWLEGTRLDLSAVMMPADPDDLPGWQVYDAFGIPVPSDGDNHRTIREAIDAARKPVPPRSGHGDKADG